MARAFKYGAPIAQAAPEPHDIAAEIVRRVTAANAETGGGYVVLGTRSMGKDQGCACGAKGEGRRLG